MVDFLPSTVDSVADEDRDPRVVGVDSEDADALVAALSSQTGRDILAALYEEPATPATIAERVETSLQNVQYHLGKLEDGNLVEVADTAYSSKGREMKVYAPTAEPLVLFAGNESDTVGLKSALSNLFGGLGVLGLASLVVQRLATNRPIIGPIFQMGSSGNADSGEKVATTTARSADAGGSAGNAATTTRAPADGGTTHEAARTTAEAATTVADKTTTALHASTTSTTRTIAESASGSGIPPGALFFAGGALILVLAFFVWYRREKRSGQR
ncbi:ArsR family transcriptional regulator [Haladaptatus sp. W1]|uniref:ArsR/SmtB family transcription factor n=1 Tax=Haladaptatus sp. W1 TaxID=1897478 RepID=UPI0008498454|nr:winged helix-turn-helix domain-containing protein [Haladaptatus sp. W1]ODR82010.1 ArsR family transcriptional regulator [Haladaptatus sp. W1]